VPLEVLSDVLGHSSIGQTKDTYGHLSRKTLSQAPEAIHTVLNGKQPAEENDEEETANQILQPTEEVMQRVLGKGKVG
jgi:hypothetical protein